MAEVLSPFLPNTNIQYACLTDVGQHLLDRAIYNDGCFDCHLAAVLKGYCYVTVGGRGGIKLRVHRLIYMLVAGKWINSDTFVLHECDNRKCINPVHLFEGTAQDNTDDMISKGRKVDDLSVGPRRRLRTASKINELRLQGLSDDEISRRLYISKSTIWNYTNGPYRGTLSVLAGDEHSVCL